MKKLLAKLLKNSKAQSGIGTLIVFIAMILVAAVAASVIIQTTYMAQQRAQSAAVLSIKEVSNGYNVLNVEGVTNGTDVNFIFIKTTLHAGSEPLSLKYAVIEISDGSHEASLYLDPNWIPPLYVLYNSTTGKFVGVQTSAPTTGTPGNWYVKLTNFKLEEISQDTVYQWNGTAWVQTTASPISGETQQQFIIQALTYAAKTYASAGVTYSVIVLRDPSNTFQLTATSDSPVLSQGTVVMLVLNLTGWNIGPQTTINIKIMPKHGVPTLIQVSTPPTYAGKTYIQLV